MQKPAYEIKVGSVTFDSRNTQEVVRAAVELDLSIPLDTFDLVIKTGEKTKDIKKGDPVTISLGYEGSLSKVFTGTVDRITPSIKAIHLAGYSMMNLLTRRNQNKVYEKQTAGDIVSDIAKSFGIREEKVEDGISFPMYIVDDTRSAYMHIRDIARKCGFDFYMTFEGKLVFRQYRRTTPKPFKYGRDILSYEVQHPTPVTASVKVLGESPASFKGADTSHWRTKKAVEGSAGSGDVTFVIEDPVVRDKESAEKVARAYLETILTPLSGTITTLGSAHVRVGDTISIKEMPDGEMNGEFEVTGITHHFNKKEGFLSRVNWVRKAVIEEAESPLPAMPESPSLPGFTNPLGEQLASLENALEEIKLRLLDAIETGEMELEKMLVEINSLLAELDRAAREMIAAAEELKKEAEKAAREVLGEVAKLEKEVMEKKKEFEKSVSEIKSKYEEYKKKAGEELGKVEGELDGLKDKVTGLKDKALEEVAGIREKAEEEVRKLQESVEDTAGAVGDTMGDAVSDTREKVSGKVAEIQKKCEEEVASAQKTAEDGIKEIAGREKEVKDRIADAKKDLADAGKKVTGELEKGKKKFDDTVGQAQDQIESSKKKAETLVKDADRKIEEVRKKADEARATAAAKIEGMKKTYNQAKDKVLQAKEQIGM